MAEVRTFRSPFFTFWDDQLFMDAGYALRLFAGLAGLGKRWAAMVTLASTRNERLLTAQITLRNNHRLRTAMRSSRLPAIKTLQQFDQFPAALPGQV